MGKGFFHCPSLEVGSCSLFTVEKFIEYPMNERDWQYLMRKEMVMLRNRAITAAVVVMVLFGIMGA